MMIDEMEWNWNDQAREEGSDSGNKRFYGKEYCAYFNCLTVQQRYSTLHISCTVIKLNNELRDVKEEEKTTRGDRKKEKYTHILIYNNIVRSTNQSSVYLLLINIDEKNTKIA